jgi:hypothetical protein
MLGQQRLPGGDVGRVEAAPVDLVEGAFDDVDLLRTHRTGLLGGCQHRPHRRQDFAQHREAWSDRLRRPHPAGRFAFGHPQHRRQHPPHAALTQHRRQIPPLSVGDDLMIEQRQPVPSLLEPLHEPDQPRPVKIIQPTVAGQLDQMVKGRHPSSKGMTDRCQLSRPTEGHGHTLLERTFDYKAGTADRC